MSRSTFATSLAAPTATNAVLPRSDRSTTPRFGTDFDAAGDGQPVVIDLQQGQIVAVPVCHHAPRAVAGDCHSGGLIAGRQFMENLAACGIDQRYRAGGLVGDQQASAVGLSASAIGERCGSFSAAGGEGSDLGSL